MEVKIRGLRTLLLGGLIVLILTLTACSDGLSPGDDDPLADREDYYVYGIVYLCGPTPPPIPHEADVGLRHRYVSPDTFYLMETPADENGNYEFPLDDLDTGWYCNDAWFETGATRWFGSSSDFYWISEQPENFERDIYMEEE